MHIRLPKLQKELHINLFRHHYGLLRVNSRIILFYILHKVRSFSELLRSLRESAFSALRIDVFLPADSCFPECGIISFESIDILNSWYKRENRTEYRMYPISIMEKGSDLLLFTHLHSFIGRELHICSLPIFLLFILTLPLHPFLLLLPFAEPPLSFFAFIEGYDIG